MPCPWRILTHVARRISRNPGSLPLEGNRFVQVEGQVVEFDLSLPKSSSKRTRITRVAKGKIETRVFPLEGPRSVQVEGQAVVNGAVGEVRTACPQHSALCFSPRESFLLLPVRALGRKRSNPPPVVVEVCSAGHHLWQRCMNRSNTHGGPQRGKGRRAERGAEGNTRVTAKPWHTMVHTRGQRFAVAAVEYIS